MKISGSAEVLLPGESTAKPVIPGMAIPQGATITTAKGGQVMLETANGVVAAIQSESTVVVEKLEIEMQGDQEIMREALLDLKKGNIVSTLDPSKKAINKYGGRTPKGVAAARGTVYGVSVNISGTSVATLTGTVTLNLGNGVSVSIPLGSGVINNAETVRPLAAAIAASGQEGLSVAQLLHEAVQVVAANVAANTSAAGGSDTATSVMAAVVSAASAAQPDQAANFTSAAAAAAQTEAAAVVVTMAQTMVNAAAAVGTTVTTESVTMAVNTGATTGSTAAGTNTNTTVEAPPTIPPPTAASPEAPAPSSPLVTPETPIDLPPVSAT